MIAFIDEYRDCFGARVHLPNVGSPPSRWVHETVRGYRAAKKRVPSQRSLRDCELIPVMIDIHRENYGVYGVGKMWHAMERVSHEIGRDQVAPLMRAAGIRGAVRGRKPITTRPATTPDVRPDLVQRNFRAPGPNRLWVAGITYVRTHTGFVYTAFVTDVYSRKIVGWQPRPASPPRPYP